jgi:integrase
MATVRMTHAFVEGFKCRPGQRIAELRDEEARGLELRVTAGGRKTWRLHYTRRSDGKRRAVALGSFPVLSLKDARARARAHQGAIESTETRADPAARSQALRNAETVADIAAEWIERHGVPNKGERTLRDDRSMLDRHILPVIGGIKAIEITKRDVIRLLDAVATKVDARTADGDTPRKMTHRPNRVFELVRSIFRWAVGRDMLPFDPTVGIKRPIKKEDERTRTLSAAEIAKLWTALDTAPLERRAAKGLTRGECVVGSDDVSMTRPLAFVLKLSLVTGQRISEVSGAALSEFDLASDAPVWTIPAPRTKNKKAPHRVPLSPMAVALIKEALEINDDSRWLFPGADSLKPIRSDAVTKAVGRSETAIGLEDFRAHDLRRTAGTQMAEMGISPHTVSLILNHSSATKSTVTARVYIHYSYDKEKRDALGAWGARLERILDGHCGIENTKMPVSEIS